MLIPDRMYYLVGDFYIRKYYYSLSEINIGKQKIYSFKDNYAFSSPERDKWIEVCYDVAVIQVRQT